MGAIMAIGVGVSNAILLVVFAEKNRVEGQSARDAAISGAQERLRPILMTSSAMVAGMIPMALAFVRRRPNQRTTRSRRHRRFDNVDLCCIDDIAPGLCPCAKTRRRSSRRLFILTIVENNQTMSRKVFQIAGPFLFAFGQY